MIFIKNIFLGIKEKITDRPLIQIYGNSEILVEGCAGILTYDDKKIVFRTDKYIEINGEELFLTNLGKGCVSICGKITIIKFGDSNVIV